MRELLQSSGKYGIPSSEIEIRVGGTLITKVEAEFFNQNPRFDFKIHYRRASDDIQLSPTVNGSLKLLKVYDAGQQAPYRGSSSGSYYMGPQGPIWAPTGALYSSSQIGAGPSYTGPQGPMWGPTGAPPPMGPQVGPTGHYMAPHDPLWGATGAIYLGPQGNVLGYTGSAGPRYSKEK